MPERKKEMKNLFTVLLALLIAITPFGCEKEEEESDEPVVRQEMDMQAGEMQGGEEPQDDMGLEGGMEVEEDEGGEMMEEPEEECVEEDEEMCIPEEEEEVVDCECESAEECEC